MASEVGTIMPPAELVTDFVSITPEQEAPIAYSYIPPKTESSSNVLILFLNGLLSTQTSWIESLSAFLRENSVAQTTYPALLTYDRYGQGRTSATDPRDGGKEPGLGHDCMDAARDAYALTHAVCARHGQKFPQKIVLVGNSIGCAIARLFTNEFPGLVAGLVMLDSIMANTDFVSLFPDVDAADFDPQTLPDGISVDMIRQTRQVWRKVFHPSVQNPEGLNRDNLRTALLPFADAPLLKGYGGGSPFLNVVGHDPEHFALETEKSSLATPYIISMTYVNPYWSSYNNGLLKTAPGRSANVEIAKNCGHFIQQDNPQLVSDYIDQVLSEIG